MKTARLLLTLLCLLSAPVMALAEETGTTTLRIGTSAGYPPLTFKQQGKLIGMEPDLAQALGAQLSVDTEMVELPFETLIPALREKRIDVIMSGLSITEERRREVLFTEPYMEIGQMGLIRTADLVEWSQPRTLLDGGKKIGVKRGTTGARFARQDLNTNAIVEFDTIETGVNALSDGQIDIFIHDAPTIWRLSANFSTQRSELTGLYRPLTREHLAWAVRPGDTQLAARLNAALEALKRDGTLSRIQGKWIPVQVKVRNP